MKKLKFVTFLPIVKEAENPFPGAPSSLFDESAPEFTFGSRHSQAEQ